MPKIDVLKVENDGTHHLRIMCPGCSNPSYISITEEQSIEYVLGEKYIQDILHDKTPDERELFQTGFCPSCWDKLFKEEDNE